MRQTIRTTFLTAHFCLMMMALGGSIIETFIYYPNWFYHIPDSLTATSNFYQARTPGQFFQIVAPLAVLSGLGFVAAGWGVKIPRNLVLASIVLVIGIELETFTYIYPRIVVLVREGTAKHSVEALNQVTHEFLNANSARFLVFVLASACSLTGLLKFFRANPNG